jgi:hypothetical protein
MNEDGKFIEDVSGIYEYTGVSNVRAVPKYQIRQKNQTIYIKRIEPTLSDWGEVEAVFDFHHFEPDEPKKVVANFYKQTVEIAENGPYKPDNPRYFIIGNTFAPKFNPGNGVVENWYPAWLEYCKGEAEKANQWVHSHEDKYVVVGPEVAQDGLALGFIYAVPGHSYIRTELA